MEQGRIGIQQEPRSKSHDSEDDEVKVACHQVNSPFLFSEEKWEVRNQPTSRLRSTSLGTGAVSRARTVHLVTELFPAFPGYLQNAF